MDELILKGKKATCFPGFEKDLTGAVHLPEQLVTDGKTVTGSHGIPEAIAVAVTAGLHLWRRNTLLSILAGTACYMALVQLVF